MRLVADGVSWKVDGRAIVDQVDLVCEPGTVTGVLGPNGSGKTSLLKLLAGLRRPASGTVRIDDDDVHQLPARDRARKIAVVEQHATTGLDLTVRQVVELGRIPIRGRWPGQSDEGAAAIERSMEIGRVTKIAGRSWQTLSGGERQRTQLARALAQEPQVLLLDEPTNHLDLHHQLDFLRTIRTLGLTTVSALHDLELAAAYCDQVLVMDAGHRIVHGPPTEVIDADLVAKVYDVEADVEQHQRTGRLQVVWYP